MLKRLSLLAVLLLVSTELSAQTIGASVGVPVTAVDAEDLTAATGTAPFDYSLLIGTNGASALTWQTIYSAAPTTVTVLLQGSTDCSTYATIDTSTSNAGEIRSVFGSWKCVRINNTAVAGGAGKTLTVKFVYSTGRVTGTVGSGIFVGGTFTSPILLPDGTATAPALSFASLPTLGLYKVGSVGIGYASGGDATTEAFISNSSFTTVASGTFAFSANNNATGATDVVLSRDASGTLALRNGGTAGSPVPQTFNVYAFCDGGAACATGYERLSFTNDGTNSLIDSQGAGTGSNNPLIIKVGGTTYLGFSGDALYPRAADTESIGNSSLSWRTLYLARSIQGSNPTTLTDAGAAVPIERVAVPTNGYAGMLTSFTANSTDGTNRLTTTGLVSWAGADTAGTPTCGAPVVVALSTAYKRANTLICTFTNVVSTTNCDLSVTCTDNLAGVQTMAIEHFIVSMPKPNTYTPQ